MVFSTIRPMVRGVARCGQRSRAAITVPLGKRQMASGVFRIVRPRILPTASSCGLAATYQLFLINMDLPQQCVVECDSVIVRERGLAPMSKVGSDAGSYRRRLCGGDYPRIVLQPAFVSGAIALDQSMAGGDFKCEIVVDRRQRSDVRQP